MTAFYERNTTINHKIMLSKKIENTVLPNTCVLVISISTVHQYEIENNLL